MNVLPADFEGQSIRRLYDQATDTWWFSVIDIVQILTGSENARDYWFKMKRRVKAEDGAELSTFCRQFKLPATDGKQRLTDCTTAESLLRIVQSIPSPKAEPIFTALAELSTRQIAERQNATGMAENKEAAQAGGGIARGARQQLEDQTGQSVVTAANYLPPGAQAPVRLPAKPRRGKN